MNAVDDPVRSPPVPAPLPKGEGTRAHTIPLYSTPAHADAWHQVLAPGGYEWWHVDADDARHDRRIVVALFDGFAFSARYAREYARYRRHPTRVPPPVPRQYPAAHVALYEGGKTRLQFTTLFAPGAFSASTDHLDVSVGPHRACAAGDGVELLVESETLRASLRFMPRMTSEALERAFPCTPHRWILTGPSCDVSGSITCANGEFAFAGHGYREHHYATAPLAWSVSRWFRGRVLLDDAAYAFHVVRPCDGARRDVVHLVETSGGSSRDVPIARASLDGAGRAKYWLEFPRTVALDDVLHLHNPRVIDESPLRARIVYDAVCRGGRGAAALCEVVYPGRLRAPLLGRMSELSVDTRGRGGASSAHP